jgi:AraC-like DNA-binding protein
MVQNDPQKMLKKMLSVLCASGAEFCYPDSPGGLSRPEPADEILVSSSRISGFNDNIPGDENFLSKPPENQPYYQPEKHPCHVEIILPVEGKLHFQINDLWHLIGTDSKVHIILRNTPHTEKHVDNTPYTLFWLTSLPSSLTLHRTVYTPEQGYGQSACKAAVFPPAAKALWQCGNTQPFNDTHYFSLLVQCLDIACETLTGTPDTAHYHYALLTQIKEYLDENFFKPCTLETLAKMAHCTPVHLNRLFVQQYGVPPHRYLMELRMTEATKLLRKGLPQGETAARTGFSDQRYFSRFFRSRYGMTPSQFRENPDV